MAPQRPYNTKFAEHYWSPAGGVNEKSGVFLVGNHLHERCAKLSDNQTFTIAEFGFGTGLNFVLTAQLFAVQAPATTRLCYIGYEAYPLPVAELQAIHAALPPALQPWLQPLGALWPTLQPGWQLLSWPGLQLWLWVGPAEAGLPTQPCPAEAWYLDGFSPAKNPEVWSLPLMQQVPHQSTPGATLATYSVARMVRDNLTTAGFVVNKCPGIPPKRDRLEGYLRPA